MTFLRNAWYMAAWADEIASGEMFARRLLDEPVAFFRDADGNVKAIADRCPHRFAPLSKGSVSNGVVSCGYHGLAFDGAGQCVHNPHGPVLKTLRVGAYPVVERFRAVWIWMGSPPLADETLIRDLGFLDEAPATAFSKGYLRGHANYQLYVDNILDLTHVDFLHADTLGSGAFTRTKAKVTEAGGRVRVSRDCLNEEPSPLMQSIRGITIDDRVDYWNDVEWSAPGILTLSGGNVPAGEARDGPFNNMNTMNVHIVSPETARTTHYFFATTRDFNVDDAAFNDKFAETRNRIFSTQDEPMIQAQQDRMDGKELNELGPALLRIDQGSVLVRRKLAALIEREQAGLGEREATG